MILNYVPAAELTTFVQYRHVCINCIADKAVWCASRRLQLNADKTESIGRDCSMRVGSESVVPLTIMHDLGVHLDKELTMKQYVAKVAASCLYHFRRLRQIHQRVGTEVTTRLVPAFITSRFDYCNSVRAGRQGWKIS